MVSLVIAFKCAFNRKTLPIAFGIFWFYVALVPSSSVVPLAEVMNHHRTFFPYMGLIMAVVWAGRLLVNKLTSGTPSILAKGLVAVVLIGVFGAHAYGTYERNEVWDNDVSLWKDVTIKSPKNGRGLMNYGLTEMRAGKMESAIAYFEKALNTSYGRHPYLYINLGIAKNSLGIITKDQALIKEAETHLKRAVQMGAGYPDCHYHYANWLSHNKRQDEAIKYLNRALELSPGHQQAAALLATLSVSAEDQLQKAEQEAIRLNTPEAYLELSLKYYNHGDYERCIKACDAALKLRPNYAEAYNNICSAYNKLQMFEKAVVACKKSLSIKSDYALAQGNLDWAKQQLNKNQ